MPFTLELQQIIDKRSAAFGENTIGVHIRRSDHKKSIASSPDAAFEFFMDQEIAANPKTDFFLATDSPDTKHHFVKKYGSRITTFYETASRLRSQGVRNAVVDLYLLSRTRKVFGSHQSSFSQAAAIIGGIENIQVGLLEK